jgi:hypothetical protein
MPIIDAYDAIAKGAREQKRHFSPSGLSDLDRRAFLVGDRGVLHAALSDFDQSAQQHEFLIKGDPVNSAGRQQPQQSTRRAASNALRTGAISTLTVEILRHISSKR